ncbi:MAG: TetR/AcrR family transcriptional regulator [Pseudomonadota bacterium]
MKAQRLSRDSWIDAGFAALPDGGGTALRAEPLARRLGTTKGSFYWHFEDVPAFHAAMLDSWKRGAFAAIVAEMEADGAAPERLRRFGTLVLQDQAGAALRAWGLSFPGAAAAAEQVDAERLTYLTSLMAGLGVTNADYPRAAYAALIGVQGISSLDAADGQSAYDTLIDLILALR